ncbi:hypothetical protein [Saccharicrinis sp. FJH54]|uniref:hypothetical protein n=1 Tax=Saccharicrinis sp. FJH54 TaxID=3344665 RepID=UPI0035D3DE5E
MRIGRLIQSSIVFVVLSMLVSCQSKGKSQGHNVAIEKTDSCLQHPSHTFQVFIPASTNLEQKIPLFIAVDPHGSGQTALNHLKAAVTEYPAVLVASNLIRNKDPNFISELEELIADVQKRYPVTKEIYLTGFSGGARMVLGYAMKHQVDGVLACGAFSGPDQLFAIKCPVMGILGMTDFNFLETVQYIFDPARLPANVHIELINGAHEWPDGKTLSASWGWFQLSRQDIKDQDRLNMFVNQQNACIDSLIKAGKDIRAICISRNMGSVGSFEKLGSFRKQTREITYSDSYIDALNALSDVLRFEVKKREEYSQALMDRDAEWWRKEIDDLNHHVDNEPDEMKQMAYARLKSFLGIACYSYASRFVVQKNVANLKQILMVYQLAEPNNADLKRFNKFLTELKGQ